MTRDIQLFNHSIFEYFLYASGWSDKSFAERLGCPRQRVFLWRTGGSKPTDENLSKIADALDIDPSILKLSDKKFSEMVKDGTNQELRRRLIKDKLYDNFHRSINGFPLEKHRHALRVAIFLNEVS